VLLAGLLACAPVALGMRFVPFKTVETSSGSSNPFGTQPRGLIKDATAWRRIWRAAHAGDDPPAPVPKVDFARFMIIAASAGQHTSGGYSIAVRRITDDGRRLRVTLDLGAPSDHCATTLALTAPYTIVRVKRSSKPVVFFRKVTGVGDVARPSSLNRFGREPRRTANAA
jgi:hypothetical protein